MPRATSVCVEYVENQGVSEVLFANVLAHLGVDLLTFCRQITKQLGRQILVSVLYLKLLQFVRSCQFVMTRTNAFALDLLQILKELNVTYESDLCILSWEEILGREKSDIMGKYSNLETTRAARVVAFINKLFQPLAEGGLLDHAQLLSVLFLEQI